MTPRRILLINPNISALVTGVLAGEARRIVAAQGDIHAISAPFGAASLECRAELAIAAHAVLEAVAANPGHDAIIVGAFGDPGLEAAEEIADAPMFGLGRSGMRAAGAGGRRFAVVTVGERMREGILRMAALYGLAEQCVAIRFLAGSVLDLAKDRARFADKMAAVANACARESEAQSVLFGGAPFSGIGRELAGRVEVPIYDGLTSAVHDAMQAPLLSDGSEPLVDSGEPKATSGLSSALARRIHALLNRRG